MPCETDDTKHMHLVISVECNWILEQLICDVRRKVNCVLYLYQVRHVVAVYSTRTVFPYFISVHAETLLINCTDSFWNLFAHEPTLYSRPSFEAAGIMAVCMVHVACTYCLCNLLCRCYPELSEIGLLNSMLKTFLLMSLSLSCINVARYQLRMPKRWLILWKNFRFDESMYCALYILGYI